MPDDSRDVRQRRGSSLAFLAEHVRASQQLVREVRCGVVVRERLLAAHVSLLDALESYAAELVARRLPVPRKLHDELRLQRSLGTAGRRVR